MEHDEQSIRKIFQTEMLQRLSSDRHLSLVASRAPTRELLFFRKQVITSSRTYGQGAVRRPEEDRIEEAYWQVVRVHDDGTVEVSPQTPERPEGW